jgi:hypothetical protein
MRSLEIRGELRDAQSDARPILGKVVAELVAFRHQPLDQVLLSSNPVSNQEERSSSPIPPQLG